MESPINKLFFPVLGLSAFLAIIAIYMIRQGNVVPVNTSATVTSAVTNTATSPIRKVPALPPEKELITETLPITPDISTAPPPIIYKRFEGMLDYVHDREKLRQDEPYNTLLKYIHSLTPAEITAKVNTNITFNDLITNPKKYRGEIIRVSGVVLYLNPYKLKTNPAGVDIYYEGILGDSVKGEKYRFHVIERPESFKTFDEERSQADAGIVEGAFLKIISYELAPTVQLVKKKTWEDAPFIIGQRLVKIEVKEPGEITQFKYFIGVFVVLAFVIIIAIFVIATYRNKPKPRRIKP
ncbi:MAG: hypothetical protein V1701_04890 [Planctomycetota bacterium]